MPALREIGGDFEAPAADMLLSPGAPPWEQRHPDSSIAYVESGRQGLAAIAQELEAEERGRLLVPAHFCDSMLEAFLRRGWEVAPLPVGDDLFPLPGTIGQALAEPHATVILHAPYFGQDTPAHVRDELAVARSSGTRLIVDETHRPLSPSEFPADFRIASLRKTLPLYDGAYVLGLPSPVAPSSDQSRSVLSELRAAAMEAKASYLRGDGDAVVHLGLFRQADRMMAGQPVPQPMSGESRALLTRLDHVEI